MDLECRFQVDIWANEYTCRSAKVTKPGKLIKNLKVTHKRGKNNTDVEIITFDNQVMEIFPRNIHTCFPNLTILGLESCGLERISRKDLSGLVNLKELTIVKDKIWMLPKDLFFDTKKLVEVCFAFNVISHMSSETFLLIKDVVCGIDFRHNATINHSLYLKERDHQLHGFLRGGGFDSFDDMMEYIDECCSPPDSYHNMAGSTHNQKMMKKLFRSQYLTDFSIKVEGEEFKVHKFLLAVNSEVFEAMFINLQESVTNHVEIKEFTAGTVRDMIELLYTGELRNEDDPMELYRLAHKYGIESLKTLCEEIILDNIDETNAVEIFKFAQFYSIDEIATLAAEKIDERTIPDEETREQLKKITIGKMGLVGRLRSVFSRALTLNRFFKCVNGRCCLMQQ